MNDFTLTKYLNGSYSLERLNIVQMGNKIGSPTTQKYYTEELIDRTNIIVKSFPDYFNNSTDYHDSFFDQLVIAIEFIMLNTFTQVYEFTHVCRTFPRMMPNHFYYPKLCL